MGFMPFTKERLHNHACAYKSTLFPYLSVALFFIVCFLSSPVPVYAITIGSTALPGATQYQSYTAPALTATGGTAPYTWSVTSSDATLPEGMSINATTGVISASKVGGQGAYQFQVQAKDSRGVTATALFTISVVADNTFGGCSIFPSNSIFHQRVDSLPVDTSPAAPIYSGYQPSHLRVFFGSDTTPYPDGIPFYRVPYNQAPVSMAFTLYGDESDAPNGWSSNYVTTYPFPANAPIEGTANDEALGGDGHVLILQTAGGGQPCKLWEVWQGVYNGNGTWSSSNGAYCGLVTHPIRFTLNHMLNDYVWPARHTAGTGYCVNSNGTAVGNSQLSQASPPASCVMTGPAGEIYRLTSAAYATAMSTCPSSSNPQSNVILTAMRQYGIILADNGLTGGIIGTPDARWNDTDLSCITNFTLSKFEPVNVSSVQVSADSGESNQMTNGTCGSINGGSMTTVPTNNLCSTGTPSAVSGSGPWSWTCAGTNGGTTASCTANKITINEYATPTANSNPWRITAGSDGNLWFTERSTNKIGKITTAGAITEYAIPTANSLPTGIALGPDNNLWFIEQNGNNIGRITVAGVMTEFPIPTANSSPWAIAGGPDGYIWFVERGDNKIARMTTGGSVTEFSIPTAGSMPSGITAGSSNNLWFTEEIGNNIGEVTTTGSVTEFPMPGSSGEPFGIVVGPDGNIWFTELGANKIGRMTSGGTITEFPVLTAGSEPAGITAGPDGNLWFAEELGNNIGKITTVGVVDEIAIPTAGSAPSSVASGSDGNIWFTEETGNNIGQIVLSVTRVYVLSVTMAGTGGGTVTSSPAGIDCGSACSFSFNTETAVTLSAAASTGSVFAGWSGGPCSGSGSCAFSLNSNTGITATFNTCSETISTSGQSLGAGANTGSVSVTASSGSCSWVASSSEPWITITSGSSGTGSGTVDYSVSANITSSSRAGTLTIAGHTFTITQSGQAASGIVTVGGAGTYSTIQAGYNNALTGNTIEVQTSTFPENDILGSNISVTLIGGYDSSFTTSSLNSTISGKLTISNGAVTVGNITIQ
ncbi:MAG: putative Ig domain-containing protein [Dissulfurispiraceae bacterium]